MEATGIRNKERDEKELEKRVRRCRQKKVATYKGVELVEPRQEIGVYGLVMQLLALDQDIFPFKIVDYDSHTGVDALVKASDDVPLDQSALRLLEFKRTLNKKMNHLFDHIHAVVCWETEVQNLDEVVDLQGQHRIMHIQPGDEGEPTHYFLDNPSSARKIRVYVLSEYLPQTLGIQFEPRPDLTD